MTQRAYTFVEIMIVVTILTIATAVALPIMLDSLDQQTAARAAARIQQDLEWARERAHSVSNAQTLSFDPPQDRYTWIGMDDPDHPGSPYVVDLASGEYAAEIVSADFGGDFTVIFDVNRIPDSGGQVQIQAGSFQKTITLSAKTGKVTVQ